MPRVGVFRVERGNVEVAVRKAIEAVGGVDIDRGEEVVVKPNIAFHKDPYGAINTDPKVLDAVLKVLREHTDKIVVVESDSTSNYAEVRAEQSGIMEVVRRNDACFVNLSKDEIVHVTVAGRTLRLPRTVVDAQYFVNVPKLKTHEDTVITVALKNMFGVLPEKNKAVFYHSILEEVIPLVNAACRQNLIVVDGITAMEGRGPITGTPVTMNIVMSGRDPVTVDTVAAHIMGFNPKKIKIITRTHSLGIGEVELEKIEVVGEPIERVARKFRAPRAVTGVISDGTMALRILFLNTATPQAVGKKVRVGVIGCGKVAEYLHLPGYNSLSNVEVVAVADLNEERLEYVKRKFGVGCTYTDYMDVLENPQIDAVSICTPPRLHKDMTVEAVEHGKYVLCEKPLATSTSEAYELLEEVGDSKFFVMPAFNYRFTPSVKMVNEIISRGKIGRVERVTVTFKSDQRVWNAVTSFRFNEKSGVLSDLGPHVIDMLHYFLGDVEKVNGADAKAERYRVYDRVKIDLIMQSGAKANVGLHWFSDSIIPSFYWRIEGTKGAIRFDVLRSPYAVSISWNGKTWQRYAVEPIFKDIVDKVVMAVRRTHYSYSAEINYFVQCVANKTPPSPTLLDGVKCVETMEQITQKL
ncbi:MAG: DUF362 domain-containing protein [Candidatus Freyarchaeota archaeon]|nr:DUF362 domain-containing protein [Candidatus Jordarchaeia archaeon]